MFNAACRFLAPLDYVSRAHEIAICPSSVVRRPSVYPSVRAAINSELNARIFFQILVVAYPGPYAGECFLNFGKHFFFYEYFSFS